MLVQPETLTVAARDGDMINLADFVVGDDVLGPGRRALIWVQGCPRRCPNCITAAMQRFDIDREWVLPAELARRVLAAGPIQGLTLLGGEPFSHARPLRAMIDSVRATADLSVVTYTGHTYERIQALRRPDWQALLDATDLLIDGDYRQELHCDLLWRGSSNQRLHFLSQRYRHLEPLVQEARGQRLQIGIDAGGFVRVLGIPDQQLFSRLRAELAARGVTLAFEQ